MLTTQARLAKRNNQPVMLILNILSEPKEEE